MQSSITLRAVSHHPPQKKKERRRKESKKEKEKAKRELINMLYSPKTMVLVIVFLDKLVSLIITNAIFSSSASFGLVCDFLRPLLRLRCRHEISSTHRG